MEPQTEKKQIMSISHSKTNSMAFIPVVRDFLPESEFDNITDKSMPLNIHVGGKLYADNPMLIHNQSIGAEQPYSNLVLESALPSKNYIAGDKLA